MSLLDVTRAFDLDFRFPASDTIVGPTLRTYGEFSRVELDILLHLACDPTGVMVDAGANIGSLALPFARARPGWIAEADRKQEDVARATIRIFFEAGYEVFWLFVPFATRTAPRNGDQAQLVGDFNVIAAPPGTPLPADIPRLEGPDAPFPTSLGGLPYLRRYGF